MKSWFISLASIAFINSIQAVPTIKADGSSTVFPITEAVSEEFQASKGGAIRVTVGISGTGGGFKKFCRAETDLQNASRPISKEEMKLCADNKVKYFEFPIAYDAIVVTVSPKNTWLKEISVDELKKLWEPKAQSTIKTWNQINPKYPNEAIKLFGAGADSGTFDYFTEAIVGKAKSSRGDFTASEDDNTLVMGIANDKNALGYIPYSYYIANVKKLKALGILSSVSPSKAIFPTKATVENGTYFPLSRPIFIYVNAESVKKNEVKEFTNFYLDNAGMMAEEVKYVSLPKNAYLISKKHLETKKIGTVFGGVSEVGLKIEDLLKREGKL